MQAERWQRVKELLNAALERNPQQRAAFLAEHCAGDPELLWEVESLLESYDEAENFMEIESESFSATYSSDFDTTAELRIGPYRVLQEIGRGGMGTVYKAMRAVDPQRRIVALKIVRRGLDHDFVVRRFRTERTILAALDHPNIAQLLDAGSTDDDLPYFVMEYVEGGKNIAEYADAARLNTRERLELFMKLCSAVGCAHERRIIHRDIKPGNVLIDKDGELKLLDFGIAKILDPEFTSQTMDATATILRLMTPEYASPEQVRGLEITTASDVYSLGVVLYELLTGHRPYRLKSKLPHEIAQVICEQSPQRPSTIVGRTEIVTKGEESITLTPELVSDARNTQPNELKRTLTGKLDSIVLTAMCKEPERRYPSASEFGMDLQRYLEGREVSARHDSVWHQTTRTATRHRKVTGGIAAAVVLAVSGLVMSSGKIRQAFQGPAPVVKTLPLTSFPGDETQPAFSPDSKRVVFVWEGENNDNSDLYIKPVRGVGLERITTNEAEDVSPTWSPDGRRLAWLRASEDETAVFVSTAQPGERHLRVASLYPNRIEAVGRHLDWSRDGANLAAADRLSPDEPFRIVTIELATGQKTQLTTPPPGTVGDSNPVYSPDGQSIAFIRGASSGVDDIFVRPLNGGASRRITNDRRFIISLAWSSDSKFLIFSSNRAGNHSLWRVPASGGEPEPIPMAGDNVSDAVMSLDGSLLAFSQFYQDTNIWEMDLQNMSRKRFIGSTQYDSSPHHSPDRSAVTFRSSRSGTNEVWIRRTDTGQERQITHMGNMLSGSPRFSPDGKWIAFDSRPDGQPDIFVIGSDGNRLTRITTEESEDVVPAWSNDGKWVYFGSNRSGTWQVWRAPADGGAPQRVTQGGGFAARQSLDGKWIYYARGRSVSGLWRVRSDGSGEEQVSDRLKPGFWAYWAMTRRGIYFADRDSEKGTYSLYLLPEPGPSETRKEPQRIAVFDRPLVLADQGFSSSPDGRTLLYAQIDQSGSDVLMMELNPSR
ncbi:MAG: serine/threonine-protein kinase [Bryobacteraceae bacterium]|nr:serine/threonine-protein kinase [Bryobacteraceae bacterium]